MTANEVIQKAKEQFTQLSRIPVDGIIGLTKSDEGWKVTLEGLERKSIPDTMDVLGLYEVRLDSDANIVSFERRKLRKRGDTEEE
ncbi:MAG: gas vesicle protein GvpO [Rectinema sp.]